MDGCTKNAAQVSYKLPSGKRVRICAMHLQRVRRNGEVGDAGSEYGLSGKYKAGDRNCAEEIGRLRSAAGTRWRVTSGPRGTCYVVGRTRRQAPVTCAITTLHAAQRRGWLKIGPWLEDGARKVEVTGKGLEVLGA